MVYQKAVCLFFLVYIHVNSCILMIFVLRPMKRNPLYNPFTRVRKPIWPLTSKLNSINGLKFTWNWTSNPRCTLTYIKTLEIYQMLILTKNFESQGACSDIIDIHFLYSLFIIYTRYKLFQIGACSILITFSWQKWKNGITNWLSKNWWYQWNYIHYVLSVISSKNQTPRYVDSVSNDYILWFSYFFCS